MTAIPRFAVSASLQVFTNHVVCRCDHCGASARARVSIAKSFTEISRAWHAEHDAHKPTTTEDASS